MCEINKSGFENLKCNDFHFVSFPVCVREGVNFPTQVSDVALCTISLGL